METVLLSVKEFGDQGAHTLNIPSSEELKVGWDTIGILISAVYGATDSKNNTARLKGFKKRNKAE